MCGHGSGFNLALGFLGFDFQGFGFLQGLGLGLPGFNTLQADP